MSFRNYDNVEEHIKETYLKMRTNQTYDFVKKMHEKYLKYFTPMKVLDVLEKLNNFVDISDPDINLPNIHHAFQTAEAIRKDGLPDWLQLVGLIHDLGKVLYIFGCDEDGTSLKEQWSLVGDTFVVGCKLPDTNIYPEFNQLNPDSKNPNYNTKYGIYNKNCGLSNVLVSFGHDEYLYQVLRQNKVTLPQEALYIIRFHSLYPHHKHNAYHHLLDMKDLEYFHWLKLFNKYDLYTKSENNLYNIDQLKSYYQNLINKYLNNDSLYW